MALIKCPECGTEISDKAPACIKCGAPIAAAQHDRHVEFHPPKVHAPGWMKLFFGVALLGVLAVFYMNAASNKSNSEPVVETSAVEQPAAVAAPDPTPTPAPLPPIQISAEQLYADYAANEVAADAKYKGKILAVSGAIESVNKDFTGAPNIVMDAGGGFDKVQALFPTSAMSNLAQLRKGQRVTVTCESRGKLITYLMLRCGDGSLTLTPTSQVAAAPDLAQPNVAQMPQPAAPVDVAPSVAAQSLSPSFDCNKAFTKVEKLICGDDTLAGLDLQMALVYKAARNASPDPIAFKEQGIEWRQGVRDKCGDVACLVDAYQMRLQDLSQLIHAER